MEPARPAEQRPTGSAPPPDYRRNFFGLAADYVSFMVSFSIFSPTTVLPSFVRHLTTSAPVIGLSSTLFRGGFHLPQLAYARFITDKPRKKPYMLLGASGRIMLLVIALAVWAQLPRHPLAMLLVLFVALAVFALTDALCSLTWLDIMASAIPANRRGRLLGVSQIVASAVGIAAGAAVGWILGNPRFKFPTNYALVFTLAATVMAPSLVALTLVREPPPKEVGAATDHQARTAWTRLLVSDVAFRRLILCRILVNMMDLATPFYVVYAADVLHLAPGMIGGFVISQTLGGIAASALLSPVSERWGPHHVVRVASAAAVAAPLFALVVHLSGGWLAWAYPLVYVALGIVNSTWILGFTNYMLEIAPERMRPAYLGVSNTLMGLLTLVPALGGAVLEATSYSALFAMTCVIVVGGFVASLGLKPPRRIVNADAGDVD